MENLKVERWIDETRNDGVSSIMLKREELELEIKFQGNLDLYFSISNFNNNPVFLIGKDNYKIYELFDILYNEVLNGITYYKDTQSELNRMIFYVQFRGEDYHQILKEKEEQNKERRKNSLRHAKNTGLVDGDSIIWKSDDFYPDVAPYFKIESLENSYQVSFGVPNIERELTEEEKFFLPKIEYNLISVRLRNSGSRYDMFNIPFMKLFNSLMEMDIEDNQIYLEEYLIEEEQKEGHDLKHILTKNKKIGR